jgi:predicted DNA binding CopG/RHH family protein
MKKIQLSSEEKSILEAFEKNALESVDSVAEDLARYQEYAKAHQAKTKQINLRLAEDDVALLKVRAARAGMPYQTLLTLLIRQFNQGKIQLQV